MLVSVQVVCGCRLVKAWGFHSVAESASLHELFTAPVDGSLDGSTTFAFPESLRDQPYYSFIAKAQTGPFQTVVASANIGELVGLFGRYLKYAIAALKPFVLSSQKLAFEIMLNASKEVRLPSLKTGNLNKKEEIVNLVISWLEPRKLGWSPDVETTGKSFVNELADTLWYLDGHKTLAERGCGVPVAFSEFQGFNLPEASKHKKRLSLDVSEVSRHANRLFSLLEHPFLSKNVWKEVSELLQHLAESLSKYHTYLKQQAVTTKENQSLLHPIRGAGDAERWEFIHPKSGGKPSVISKYSGVRVALQGKEHYDPVLLDELLPASPRERRYFLDSMKDGLQLHCCKFSHAYGNCLGSLHFIWLIPENATQEELHQQNNRVASSVRSSIPIYHTRAMRKRAMQSFGHLCNVKPAFLRDFYRRCTGDASASHSLEQAEVDKRIQLLVDSEDPSIIWDLRSLNEGRKSQYDEFWEACERYLNITADTAVDERRHDQVVHLASALSVSDLVREVSKLCPPETMTPSEQWVRLQFWPKDPFRKSLQYTCRLKVKYMVQCRQFRQSHADSHYAAALYRIYYRLIVQPNRTDGS